MTLPTQLETFLGTAITSYDVDDEATDPSAILLRPSRQPWKQVATDEKGRKRFHGAFTGGFSAGYFNTVGSKEGWSPSPFKSTRSKRAHIATTGCQDFMDDEDYQDHVKSTQQLTVRSEFALGEQSRKSRYDCEVTPMSMDKILLQPITISIGKTMMKALGWKEGTKIGKSFLKTIPKRIRHLLSDLHSTSTETHSVSKKRKLGPEIPLHIRIARGEIPKEKSVYMDLIETEEALYRKQNRRHEFLIQDAKRLFKPKIDVYGIGYSAPIRLYDLHGSCFQNKAPLNINSAAHDCIVSEKHLPGFGVGVFEGTEDWEDVFQESLFNPEEHDKSIENPIAIEDEKQSPINETNFVLSNKNGASFSSEDVDRSAIDGRPAIDGFHFSHAISPRHVCTIIQVPSNFRGKHMSDEADPVLTRQIQSLKSNLMTNSSSILTKILSRGNLLGETKALSVSKQHQSAKVEAQSALSSSDVDKSESKSTGGALWSGMTEELKEKLFGRTGHLNKWTKSEFDNSENSATTKFTDLEKQNRFDLFCRMKAGKVTKNEFNAAYAMLPGDKASELNEFELICAPSYSGATSIYENCQTRSESKINPVRTVFDWRPNLALCKRWGVPDPWTKKRPINIFKKAANYQNSQTLPHREFESSDKTLSAQNDSHYEKEKTEIVENRAEVAEQEEIIYQAPKTSDIGLFKAIFGDNDSSDAD